MTDMPDQGVVRLLKTSCFEGDDRQAIETVTTHISLLLLGGETALKLKRPVRLPYVDFSTPELRLAACERELELNRRTAPQLYRGVHRVTLEDDGALKLDGAGKLVDAVVVMHRFDETTLLDRMAEDGALTEPLMARLGASIASFHASLPPQDRSGGARRMAVVLDVNEAALATTELFGEAETRRFNAAFRAELARFAPLLDRRAGEGLVRRGHGDLHLRNICLVNGEPVLFDCLEFDETLGTTDVLYDLAFLLMDLWHRDLPDFANLVLNRYLDLTGDEAGLPALPFFMAVRAAVRAHVGATAAEGADENGEELAAAARSYFDLAVDLLRPREARLVAVGGLSGSGKSTVAARLAAGIGPVPGARTVSSDRLRKRLFGVSPDTRLAAEAYAPEVTARVYDRLAEASAAILGFGHAVVADATFERKDDRDRMAAVARTAATSFHGLWLDVPAEELLRRVGKRRGDPSDATEAVVRRQLARDHGSLDWTIVPGEGDPEAVAARAGAVLAERAARCEAGDDTSPPRELQSEPGER
ncbi:bifunctional aminoglycoside phosphotransferase/ATP-binding protein [Aurantimonas sp. VKM B-3413]|uniref:bifunctional aminoglycoside phosphotransferase/ATP-binding protein n=1 Tax=Aurantimonas sp. VKM B-3413 TaxID=2779401 RepID=UPI001E2E08F2|nr:bifunctional aminoglycoside phosphotransferase/ATP-binding protein [Aurantimonas sp. VKM B-3413]MCB8836432.1 AAA family ATPase [Aurantimonas sp. VKM B-3413]